MTETGEGIPPLEITLPTAKMIDPEVTIIQQTHSGDRTATNTEVIIDNKSHLISTDRSSRNRRPRVVYRSPT